MARAREGYLSVTPSASGDKAPAGGLPLRAVGSGPRRECGVPPLGSRWQTESLPCGRRQLCVRDSPPPNRGRSTT